MKFIISYIKQLFKPNFELSEEDIEILKVDTVDNEDSKETEEISTYQDEDHLDLLLGIYNEAVLNDDKLFVASGFFNFIYLSEYKYLIAQNSERIISFLYFLIEVIKLNPARTSHISEAFKTKLFADILATELNLTNSHLIDFFVFWKSIEKYKSKFSFQLITKKIILLSDKESINKELLSLLKRYINYNINSYRYNKSSHKYIEQFYRVITNNEFKDNSIPFVLLPDFFGKKVNKICLTFDKKNDNWLSKFLQILSSKGKERVKKQKITKVIENVNEADFIDICIQILELASVFKPKLRLTIIWQSYLKKYVCRKDYFGMFNENILIIHGILEFLIEKSAIKKVSLSTIVIITKRSYIAKQEIRLGSSTTKLGDLGLEILGYHYGEEGKEKLQEIYNEISYKKVRKKIDVIFEDLIAG